MESKNNMIDKLNELLATYQIHYQNLRALHWNIKGANFFELHLKYEELYNAALIVIDDLAERILTLEQQPLHRFEDYLKYSKLSENARITDGSEGMSYLVNAQATLMTLEKEILDLSGLAEDDGTNSMMSDLLRENEKTTWMFKAWLNK